jgi:hypothetical protein
VDQSEEVGPVDSPVFSAVDDAAEAVSALEGELVAAQTRSQFEVLFRRGQTLAQQIELDESLGPHERAAVEQHVRDVVRRARMDYDRHRAQATSILAANTDRMNLALETLAEADTVAVVQEVRADLRLVREAMQGASAWAARDAQNRSWELWQRANQAAWDRLNELWKQNELGLAAHLDRAEAELGRGNPRGAKLEIKAFHELAKASGTSHATMKSLHSRARELWDRSTAASKERHEAYVVIARKRLDYMRTLLGKAKQNRQRIEADIAMIEANLQTAQTDVAAALLRGQLQERRKELRRLDSETNGLMQRISEAEAAVT